MTELPGQISRDDDLSRQRNNLASHRNSFDKGFTKSDSLRYSVISTTNALGRRANILNNRTNQVDRGVSCLENKFEPEDNRKRSNLYNKELLLCDMKVTTRYYNNLSRPNNGIRDTRVKSNVSTPSEKPCTTKGKKTIIQRPLNIHQDIKPSRSAYDIHRISPGSQENKCSHTDGDDDDDDDDEEEEDNLCKGDVVNNLPGKKREEGDRQGCEEQDGKRWAEKILRDRKHRTNEIVGTRKLYQRGRMSEAASRREIIRLMQNSILGDSLRKSLHTNQETGFDDRMEVSSVESLTWEERPMTPTSSDNQDEDFNHEQNISEPTPLTQSENSLTSKTSDTHTQTFKISHPNRFKYFIDAPDPLDILEPAERGSPVKCHIIKYTNGMVRNFCPIYYLYVMNEGGVGTFLLAARKRLKCMGSSYVICEDSIDLSRDGSSYIAKLKANLIGTEYRLLCKRCNAENCRKASKEDTLIKPLNEIAGIIYEYANILGISNPETLTVVIPRLNSCQERMEIILDDVQEGLIERWRQNDLDDLIEMPNRKPWINEETKKYELNFCGRSPEFSYKNFQILCDDSVALQVGQIDKDLFFMDFQYPLCTLQAFAIALSCFDRK